MKGGSIARNHNQRIPQNTESSGDPVCQGSFTRRIFDRDVQCTPSQGASDKHDVIALPRLRQLTLIMVDVDHAITSKERAGVGAGTTGDFIELHDLIPAHTAHALLVKVAQSASMKVDTVKIPKNIH